MHYTTVSVGLVEGHEVEGINEAIKQATQELANETGGLVELVNVVPVPLSDGKLCLTVLAKPYEPPNASLIEALRVLGWGPETARGTIAKPAIYGMNFNERR